MKIIDASFKKCNSTFVATQDKFVQIDFKENRGEIY